MDQLAKGKYYVTVAGEKKLDQELQELEGKRAQIAQNIRIAKGYGDLKENFEYHEAKREQGFLEGRIAQLRIIVPSLQVIAPADVLKDRVGFGSVVTVKEDGGDEWDFLIVGALEADPMEDRISYESPLGSALLGRKVGDVVDAEVPAGKVRYTITGLRPYEE